MSLRVVSASDRTHRIGRTPGRGASNGSSWARATPSSPVPPPVAGQGDHPPGRQPHQRPEGRPHPTQRGVGHRRTGVQIPGHGPLGSGGRFFSFVNIASRGRSRSRRISTSPHSRPITAARPRGLAPPILAMATPPRGANPSPRRRAHVLQNFSGRRGTRMIGRGRDGPRVGGFTNDDTPVAIAGALTRSRPLWAVGGARAPTPGLAHRASLRGEPHPGGPSHLHKPVGGPRHAR